MQNPRLLLVLSLLAVVVLFSGRLSDLLSTAKLERVESVVSPSTRETLTLRPTTLSPTLRHKTLMLTLRPTVSRPTLQHETWRPTPGADRFVCLKDEPKLWEQRRAKSEQFQQEYCDPKQPLDPRYADGKERGIVPVVFIYGVTQPISDDTNTMLSLALNTAAKFNDRVFLLLFGALTDIDFAVLPNVEIVALSNDKDPVFQAFESFGPSTYQHHSINAYDYELFCFKRWFGLLAFLEQRNFKHVFVADNDILLLSNVTRDAERCFVGCRTFGYRVYSVYARTETVREYIDFLWFLYSERGKSTLNNIRAQFPVVSDMNAYTFLFQSAWNKTSKQVHTHPYCYSDRVLSPLKQALKRLAPFEGAYYRFDFYQDELQMPLSVHGEHGAPHPFQNLHFQGPDKKPILERCPRIKV